MSCSTVPVKVKSVVNLRSNAPISVLLLQYLKVRLCWDRKLVPNRLSLLKLSPSSAPSRVVLISLQQRLTLRLEV